MESRSFANAHASHFRDSSRKLCIRRGALLENIPRTLEERGSDFQPVEQTDEKQLAIDKNQAAVRNVPEKRIQIHDRSHVLAVTNSSNCLLIARNLSFGSASVGNASGWKLLFSKKL